MHTPAAKGRRAHRYEIRTDIRFRPEAVQNWHLGQTENISDTGLLVRSPEPLPIDTAIQLELYAPVPLSGIAKAPLICSGRVVRSMSIGAEGVVRIAIALQSSQLQPETGAQKSLKHDPKLIESFHILANQLAVVVGTAELLLTNGQLDDVTVARLRRMKEASLEAAATAKRMFT